MAVFEEVERRTLKHVDEDLSELQRSLEEAAHSGALDREVLERLEATTQDLARRVNENLPPHLDPTSADEIRRRLVEVLTLKTDEMRSLDVADHFLMEVEAVRHIIRDLLQEQPPIELRDAQKVVQLLEEWLPTLSVASLAELLGLSPRQLQRRRHDGGAATHRQQLIARLVAILRHGWTDQGVAAWFYRPRAELGDARPIDLLDEEHERELLNIARAGRVQGGV